MNEVMLLSALLGLLLGFQKGQGIEQRIVKVSNSAELRFAILRAKPGEKILLSPGEYEGGLFFQNVKGEPNKPITIAALDPANPPVIKGGGECLHFSEAAYLELHNLVLVGARYNGLNIDDGGTFETPARNIKLVGLLVRDIGPQGNCDGIKLSGVTDFRVERCTVERWGDGGQGIDMVGCHNGVIENCVLRFEDDKGFGIQAKGGSSNIVIRRCRFERAGARAVQIGGSTGLQFFRPPLKKGEAHAEAKNISVEGCTFIGSTAAIAFVGVDGAVVRFNTIYRPKRWAFRILQETRAEGFVPCRNGVVTDNLIVFRSDEWFEGGINIGPETAPQTFVFARNWWYCTDKPELSKPSLPVPEKEGVYGIDPKLVSPEEGHLKVAPDSPARKVGAHALPK
ncbi:MAG: right-handed parallel beta-helix repeat-containing protein [Armatimonadetes bacterium]|nr:right-handed parallel beta-helix repeat-containing protein [Armatimonadota bacterium]MCX7968553.1 right-handed parallel beta-helix repeat-containing protein [Armatimonadota bacterium]MDW8141900.1 right-handed parallel beta-helix repeat-containing protein [Armatimonadota bacterium]